MQALPQETIWICLAVLAGALCYWRGRRSAIGGKSHDVSVEHLATQVAERFGSVEDQNRRVCQEIETLHRRISWIRRAEDTEASGTTFAAEEAAQ